MSSDAPPDGAAASTGARSARSRSTGAKPRPKLARPTGPPPACPRCQADSEHTKFCYYNNYNVNQPRYYCKACQRHWTAGGTLRKVESGAGKRNNRRQRSVGPGGKSRGDGLDGTSTASPAAGSDNDPTSHLMQAGDSTGAGGWTSAAGRAPETFMAASAAPSAPSFEHHSLPWPAGFASAELPDEMLVASDHSQLLKQDASQALLDVDTVFADKALDAMFAPSAAAASASAPAQLPTGAWANASTPSVTHQLSSASDSQVHCTRGQPGLARNWPHAAHGGAPAGAGAPVGMLPTTAALRTHLTSGPPPMVASSYPAAPQVFDAPLDGTPGMGVQHPVARAPAWAHGVASEAPARSRSVKRDSRGEAKPRSGSEGSNDRARLSDVGGHAAAQLPYGWLPLDHPGAEAQRLHAAHAARDAALQMQRQAAMYPAMAPPYMAVPQNAPPQHAQRPQLAPGTYSCPPLGAVNVARAHYPAAVPISNAPNWQHVGLHSSSMSTQSIPHQDAGLNAAFDYAMAAAAHTASPPPLKRVASESAPGSFVVRHAGAVSPGAGGPPQQ